ncbi:MAG: glycosyltransferase family 39 protein [Bacteroidales bacterium]|nr:glycosyltransferase family 39 protein [Bacteroidales bacterium]
MGKVNNKLLILLAGIVFFIPFLGGVHLFDWDEINFAEIAREMIVSGNYLQPQINFQPFWEKPPLFFWFQSIAMQLFGIGEFSARFPNAIAGIFTLLLIYSIGKKLVSVRFGLLWTMAYFGSELPHLYFKSGIIDPVFNLFIFLGIYLFILMYWKLKEIGVVNKSAVFYLLFSGVAIGAAILTKGPVGYLIPLLTWGVYWILNKFRFYVSILRFAILSIVALAVTFTWFGIDILVNGTWFIKTFTQYQIRLFSTQDAGHGGFPGYHFVVNFIGCFPASVFAIRAFYKSKPEDPQLADFRKWMLILFWVVILLFTVVQSKIVHYSSMVYFPITFLAALTLDRIVDRKVYFNGWMRFGVIGVGSLFALVTIALPFLAKSIDVMKPLFEKDPFAMANLDAQVRWTGWEALAGMEMIAVVVFAIIFMKRGRLMRGIFTLFIGTAFFVQLTLFFFIGRIEGYSQDAAVEFCESLQDKDCYITTTGYKSYVQYFYARVKPQSTNLYTDKNWLLNGNIDKDVYFMTKIHRADELRKYEQLEELYSKNGFVFFKRQATDLNNQ